MSADASPGRSGRVVVECDVVLFDLDGTLVDSTPVVDRIWSDLARRLGRRPEDVIGRFHGMQAGAALLKVDPTLTAARVEELRTWVIDEEMRDLDGVRPIPGAPELLEQLPIGAWAVVTSCPRPLALARLDAAGLPLPAVMVTAEDVTDGKPHPAPFALGAALMDVDPSQALAVEDAPAGIASAQGAGCSVLGLLTTHQQLPIGAIEDLRDLRVDGVDDGLRLSIPGAAGGHPDALTVEEAAATLHADRTMVEQWVLDGVLTSHRDHLGRQLLSAAAVHDLSGRQTRA